MSEQPTSAPKANELPREPGDARYQELQRLVFYADQLHTGRYSAWLIAHYSLLAVVAAAYSSLPKRPVLVFAGVGVLVSVLWIVTAKALSDRIDWINSELRTYKESVHARYLKQHSEKMVTTTLIMTWILPFLLAAAWGLIAYFKTTAPSPASSNGALPRPEAPPPHAQ